MLTCKRVRPHLVGFLLGELPPRQLRAVAAHAGKCPGCLQELVALRRAVATLAPLEGLAAYPADPLPPLTAEEKARLRARVRAGRRRPVRVALALGAAALLLLAMLLGPPSPAPAVARVVRQTGQPQYRLAGQEWRTLAPRAAVPLGATLRTGDADFVEVEFADGSRARLDFASEARVDTRSDAEAVARADLQLAYGRVWLLVTPAHTGLRVRTRAGDAEALGTVFAMSVGRPAEDAETAAPDAVVTVVRGKVRVSNRHGKVVAASGMTTAAHLDRAPDAPRAVTSLSSVRWQVPWGQSEFETWLLPPLCPAEAPRQLIGRRGWLGLELAPAAISLSGESLPGPGLTVLRVVSHSPVAEAGCLRGDRLVRIGQIRLTTHSDTWRAELQYLPGARVPLVFARGGRERRVIVTLREAPFARDAHPVPDLEQANRDVAGGLLARAEGEYAALTESSATAAAFHNLGVLAEAGGKIARAETYYQRAVERDGLDPRYRFSLGMALLQLGNSAGAVREFEAALTRDPQHLEARLRLGSLLAFLGRFPEAQFHVDRLCSDPDTRLQGLCLAGELARLQNDLPRALQCYEEAYRLDPLASEPPTYLGALYYARGELMVATLWTERALARDPTSVSAWNRLGLIQCRRGQYRDAVAALREAEKRLPSDRAVYTNLAIAYHAQGDLPRTIDAFGQALALAPDDVPARLGLASALAESRDFEAAERQYRRLLELDPTCKAAYVQLAALYRQRGESASPSARTVAEAAQKYGL